MSEPTPKRVHLVTTRERTPTTGPLCSLAARVVVTASLIAGAPACAPGPATDEVAVGVGLDRAPGLEVRVPPDSRDGRPPPTQVATGPWGAEPDGTWSAASRIAERTLFPHRPPPDVVLQVGGVPAILDDDPAAAWRWRDGNLRTATPSPEPPAGVTVASPSATAAEARLNLVFSGIPDPVAFARHEAEVAGARRAGLLLPAPARATIPLTVPAASDLWFTVAVLPPAFADLPPSDGAWARATLRVDGADHLLWEGTVAAGEALDVRAPLDRFAGRSGRIVLESAPGGSATADYVFFADPAVRPRRARPRRVVFVFVDTLRADATSAYGHPEDTTPWLTELSARGLRFTAASSVAPWTLPSWRAAITGRRPPSWPTAETLAARLRARGWATALLAGNVYLTSRFEAGRGFGLHRATLAPPADRQVDDAVRWLDDRAAVDAFLVVHLMDPHLPYLEPAAWRHRFAGPAPDGWPEAFNRSDVLARSPGADEQAWIQARYLNNVAYVDAALRRLDAALSPDDLLVFFSDHGEEFWDHGGFEHGHTLEDELIRIPLVIRGAGVPVGTVDAPVSLLDLAPTVLGWVGEPADGLDGRDLLRGAPADRPLPLGYPLYGFERWGVTTGAGTLRTVGSERRLTPTANDADGPRRPTGAEDAAWLHHLGEAHGAPVAEGVRVAVVALPDPTDGPIAVTLTMPGGVSWVHAAATPLPTDRIVARPTSSGAEIALPAGWRGVHEVVVVPADADAPVAVTVTASGSPVARGEREGPASAHPGDLVDVTVAGARVVVGAGLAVGADAGTEGHHPAEEAALRALGYVGPASAISGPAGR